MLLREALRHKGWSREFALKSHWALAYLLTDYLKPSKTDFVSCYYEPTCLPVKPKDAICNITCHVHVSVEQEMRTTYVGYSASDLATC